jgi:hypothetical protein
MQKLFLIISLLLFISFPVNAQVIDSSRMGWGMIIGNDTIIHREIKEIWVYPRYNLKSKRFQKQYSRLIQRVKKVYPYAKKANELLIKYQPVYEGLKTYREKRKLMKKVEDELWVEYKDDLKRMSITDGKVLIKLIDRETGRTSYSIIKDFRGGMAATFWQGIARIFKNDLKDEYDPYGEDFLLEEIVQMVETGYL